MSANTTTRTSSGRVDLALLLLRVIVGIIFMAHGGQKLFVFGLEGVQGGFQQMGVPLPAITGPLISVLEFLGGAALILGLFSRVVAVALAADMAGAILFVHLKAGFFVPQGYEFVLLLMIAALTLAIAGGGRPSVDALIARSRLKQAA